MIRRIFRRTSAHFSDARESRCTFAATGIPYVAMNFPRVAQSRTAKIISNSKKTNMSAKLTLASIVSNEAGKYKSVRAGFVVFSGSYL